MAEPEQHCPICERQVEGNERYPQYLCAPCASKALSRDGRLVKFDNLTISGGLCGHFIDTGNEYPSDECFIDGFACRAEEARFGGVVIQPIDFRKFYDLETYLFTEVRKHFAGTGIITPFNFYCIIVWKANRAKSIIKKGLAKLADGNFGSAVENIAAQLWESKSPEDRLRVLMEQWKLRLPTASAVLAVLYPDEFTIYDVRACESIGDFHGLGTQPFSNELWSQYISFKDTVSQKTPKGYSLRDKDRYLWGKSFYEHNVKEAER
jgi:hypothetical protein